MNGFNPLEETQDQDELMRRLAQMLRDSGFGAGAALRRVLGSIVAPIGLPTRGGGGVAPGAGGFPGNVPGGGNGVQVISTLENPNGSGS